jgi:7-carboxy-7-deazaguanine synthase
VSQLNTQPPEKRVSRPDGYLDVVGTPFLTIQGEGPFSGLPAVFVRLAGCNLQCPDCDTDYTSDRRLVHPDDLRREVLMAGNCGLPGGSRYPFLVVITGGEPFRQEIGPFVRSLLADHHTRVQIETNGSLYLEDFPYCGDVTIVCSPKVGVVHPELRPYIKNLKYVVEAGKTGEYTQAPLHVLGNDASVAGPWTGFRGTVWVSPADQQNEECLKANIDECVRLAFAHGYRVSLQAHKIMGVP